MLYFRDSNQSFKLDGDLLKTMTNHNFNVARSNPQDQKLIYEFGKEINFNIRQIGRKSNRNISLAKLPKSPAIMASAISTKFLPEIFDEMCERLKLLLKEKQAGNNSKSIDEKTTAIVDKLLEYKCISNEKHKILLVVCLN